MPNANDSVLIRRVVELVLKLCHTMGILIDDKIRNQLVEKTSVVRLLTVGVHHRLRIMHQILEASLGDMEPSVQLEFWRKLSAGLLSVFSGSTNTVPDPSLSGEGNRVDLQRAPQKRPAPAAVLSSAAKTSKRARPPALAERTTLGPTNPKFRTIMKQLQRYHSSAVFVYKTNYHSDWLHCKLPRCGFCLDMFESMAVTSCSAYNHTSCIEECDWFPHVGSSFWKKVRSKHDAGKEFVSKDTPCAMNSAPFRMALASTQSDDSTDEPAYAPQSPNYPCVVGEEASGSKDPIP